MADTTNTDGLPAPEARVRAYLEAQAEEDARTGTTTDEIAWAVPEGGPLVALAVADIRDTVAELESWRTTAEGMRRRIDEALGRHPYLVPTVTVQAFGRDIARIEGTER